MSKRNEIIDGARAATARGGLVYTEVLGWIDPGHARGDDIRILMAKFKQDEAASTLYYDITYAQSMVSPYQVIRVGKFIKWRIRKGRSYQECKSIALAMMITLAGRFEKFQSTFPNNMVTASGFSGEDLVSDLLGFYRVMSTKDPFSVLRPVSKEEALKRWDYYGKIGSWKNENFKPILFPDPERFPGSRPRTGELPDFMQTIKPYNDWSSGNVAIASMDGSFIQSGKQKDLII
ncbi:hypothetical protein [Pantoea sp. CCBC3-3-1]|uniref:hypothetical protein n=1 Tax=Pantoea sp. CCBC3-3-1 TaxID=2490851 RepID=UPI0011BE086F|nr:hypothetical protein [Pantoea sp. CCBC3-3-1]